MKPNRHDVARLADSVISVFESLTDRYIDSQHRGIALNASHQARQTIAGVSSSQLRNSANANTQIRLSKRVSRATNAPKTKFGMPMTASAQTLQTNTVSSNHRSYGSEYKGAERRHNDDRRNYGLRTFWRCLMDPRRYNGRRREDRRFPLMDTFDSTAMCLAVALMILSITDAVLTLNGLWHLRICSQQNADDSTAANCLNRCRQPHRIQLCKSKNPNSHTSRIVLWPDSLRTDYPVGYLRKAATHTTPQFKG